MNYQLIEWRNKLEEIMQGKNWFNFTGKLEGGFEVMDSPLDTRILFAPDGLIIGCVEKKYLS